MTKKQKYQTLREHLLIGADVIPKYTTLPDTIPEEAIKDLLDRGLIRKISVKEATNLDEENAEKARLLQEAKKAKLNPDKDKTKKLARVGRWNINPRTLVGKNLDQLNIMIAERDTKAPRFETLEEAAAFLTKDFRGE